MGAKWGKPVLGDKWPFLGLSTPWHLPNLPIALAIVVPCIHRVQWWLHPHLALGNFLCCNSGGFWPVTPQKYVWSPKAMINIIQNLYELGWCLAILSGTQHTWYGGGSISNIFEMGAFWAILYLFYCSLQVLLVYFDHMHILKVSWCSNYGPIPCFDVVAAYFQMILLGIEIWHVGQNAMFVFWRQE